MDHRIINILKHYTFLNDNKSIRSIDPITGGLSEAKVYKICTIHGDFALRRWPETFSSETLTWIHSVLGFVQVAGIRFFSNLVRDSQGKTVVADQETHWELANWVPGEALNKWPPHDTQLIDTFNFIAKYHNTVTKFSEPFLHPRIDVGKMGKPPGIGRRLEFLGKICNPEFQAVIQGKAKFVDPYFSELVTRTEQGIRQLAGQIRRELEVTQNQDFFILPAIRDLQTEHILFDNGHFSGVVDYGSMQPDSVAADLARIGEYWRDQHPDLWQLVLSTYQQTYPLTEMELRLIDVYDHSSRILSPANWIQWILIEQRHFEITPELQNRWRMLTARLEELMNREVEFFTG